jgi:hypothetical protein
MELLLHHYQRVRLRKLQKGENALFWRRHFVTRPSIWGRKKETLQSVNLKQTLRLSLATAAYHMILGSLIRSI